MTSLFSRLLIASLLSITSFLSLSIDRGRADELARISAEPILGPFLPAGRQLAQSVTNLVTHSPNTVAEYGHLFNMRSVTGFGGDGGANTNLGVFSYAEKQSGNVWGAAFDLQLSEGTNLINANSVEVDLNNYRADYGEIAVPVAVGMQLFFGGPHRSSAAVAIGEQGTPRDSAHVVNGLIMCCATLISGSTFLDMTNSSTSLEVRGSHAIGLNLSASRNFSAYQIYGKGWNVNPTGIITASSFISALRTPKTSRENCAPGQSLDDYNFHYVCVAKDHWRRTRLQDF